MGCCWWCFEFSFSRKDNKGMRFSSGSDSSTSQMSLLPGDFPYGSETWSAYDSEFQSPTKRSEEILVFRMQHGLICREFPIRETHELIRSEDENGNKMVNEYVREFKIGAGSYGKVVLYRSQLDGKLYAIKSFHKSHLLKQHVAPSETAMSDVHREVLIMKMLSHPNIVNLIEVIDDPATDHFYMVLEYVEGKWVHDGAGPPGGIGEHTARRYLRDIVCGLMYLHAHMQIGSCYCFIPWLTEMVNEFYVLLQNIVHGDIKPDNLLVTGSGTVKIGDFGVSQVFEDDNDELHRSPGTPVFTAPECCLGPTYHGKAADIWAVGVSFYCMVLGKYPFLGDTLHDTYDKIVNDPLSLPNEMDPLLKSLLEGLLHKDPRQRITLEEVAEHAWVVGEEGPIPQYMCWCKHNRLQREHSNGSPTETLTFRY